MKRLLSPPGTLALLAAVPIFYGALASRASAQLVTLVNWDQTWNYMHPTTGSLPAGSGATEPNSGATKWYAPQAEFAATYTGPSFTTAGVGYDAGGGMGPIGYGAVDYFAVVGAEMTALRTTLTTPTTKYGGYFRTTFTVPNDGNYYASPTFKYLLDDGGYVYLDGERILRVGMAATAADNYTTLADASFVDAERNIRIADMSQAVGTLTGGNSSITPVLSSNAYIEKRLLFLTPGEHTLAVSVHNLTTASSDLAMALQLQATATTCSISGTFDVTRGPGALPQDPSDDVVNVKVNVTPTGTVSPAGWKVSSPFSVVGTTGAYSTDVTVSIPVSDFPPDSTATPTVPSLPTVLTIEDAGNPSCTTGANIQIPRIIATDDRDGLNLPITTVGPIPPAGWVFDDAARTMYMNSGVAGARKVVTSQVIDLSNSGATLFTGSLLVHDTSSGTEAADSFVAYLVIDGNVANRANLITAYDTQIVDGVLTDDELASGAGDFTKDFSYIVPASANSVQIVIEGVNDSPNEFYTVSNLKFSQAPPTLLAIPAAVTIDNKNTDDAADDTFGTTVLIEGVNLGGSTGWTSDTTPANGLYSDPQPVLFGNFPISGGAKTFTLTDALNPGAQKTLTLTPPATTLTVTGVTNITRHENGPGLADDTVTFDAVVTGANGAPHWSTTTAGVTPLTGNFGPVNFTINAPLPASPLAVTISDAGYPTVAQTVSIAYPGRYVLGQSNVTGTFIDLASTFAPAPAAIWVNDAAARTLTTNTGVNATTAIVLSEVLDLSAVGDVHFSAILQLNDTSAGSNYDLPDKFKLELIIDGGLPTETVLNLVTPYDVGDGLSSVPGGIPNGPPDGWINGYTGVASVADGFATAIDEYNAFMVRDEFNRNSQGAADQMASEISFSGDIPASATTVQMRMMSQGINGTETAVLRDVLFAAGAGPVDSDGDGMTDTYEDANGLNKNDPNDKLTDLDSDGQSNYAEYLAGTAANNPASMLKITDIARTAVPTTYNVSIATVAGKRYQLQASPDLGNTGVWTNTGGLIVATGPTTTVPVNTTGLGAKYFLRAKVVP